MKLFELFETSVASGMENIKKIAQAATTPGGTAEIMLGDEPVTLERHEAIYIYSLYKSAIKSGRQEAFMKALTDPAQFDRLMKSQRDMIYKDRLPGQAQAAAARIGQPAPLGEANVMENVDTLNHIVSRFPKEVKDFEQGHDLTDDLYEALFDYYALHGEMPYTVAKARTADPFIWVSQKFAADLGIDRQFSETSMYESKIFESRIAKLKEADPLADLWGDDDEEKPKRVRPSVTTKGGTVTKTATGVVHKGTYGSEYQGDDDEDEFAPKKPAKSAEDKPKQSRGRPSATIKKSDAGISVTKYASWYNKSKRSHPERKIVGSERKAVAIVMKNGKNYIVGEWDGSSGSIHDKATKTITTDKLSSDYKSAKGRPKKVREWIETLRYVAEGSRKQK